MKKIAIFGSTGSIGTNTLRVIDGRREDFCVGTLVAGSNIGLLVKQIGKYSPEHVYIKSEENAGLLREKFPGLDVYCGEKGMKEISSLGDSDLYVSALVGIAGLEPTWNMIHTGKTVALANKEVLVTGGQMVMDEAKASGTQLVTIDSEHSAIMQCLRGEEQNEIDRILLTASGGPFLDREIDETVTKEDALNHPTWSMGKKITIDSATMMNKGFEVIEAGLLFGVPKEKIQVVIHRKSLVHSMVQFTDGTIMASIGPRDMRVPIAYALDYPNRCENGIEKLDLFEIGSLEFEKPDLKKFKCLRLAYDAIEGGHSHQVVLNAANEVLVGAFLGDRVKMPDIPDGIERALLRHTPEKLGGIDDILELDRRIKRETESFI